MDNSCHYELCSMLVGRIRLYVFDALSPTQIRFIISMNRINPSIEEYSLRGIIAETFPRAKLCHKKILKLPSGHMEFPKFLKGHVKSLCIGIHFAVLLEH